MTFFVSPSIDNGWQSHQNDDKRKDGKSEINDKHVVDNYLLTSNNQRLNPQNIKEPEIPPAIDHGSNFSSIAGKATEATETSPMSEAISANLSDWRLDNFNDLNSNIDYNYSNSHDDVNLDFLSFKDMLAIFKS